MVYTVRYMAQKKILTGIKPTGNIHIGNYFGTIQQMVELQKEGNLYLFLADLHALTDLHTLTDSSDDGEQHNKEAFAALSEDIIRQYISLGVDPEKTVIYRQSEFPQITELAWIFSCLLSKNYLNIGHARKSALQQNKQVGLGTFLYPVLMAADILLPGGEIVPVGKDQLQHIEIAREIARKFNKVVGVSYFTDPQERVVKEVAVIPGIDGNKMSKSKNNILPIFSEEDVIRKKIMSIKTDSTPPGQPIQPENCIVCDYLKLVLSRERYEEIVTKCRNGSITYKELKEHLMKAYFEYFADARKQYEDLGKDDTYLNKILEGYREEVNTLFTNRLNKVHNLLGLGTL